MAAVGIAVVLGQQVDVVEDDAAPRRVSESFPRAGVMKPAFVEGAVAPLKDGRNAASDVFARKRCCVTTDVSFTCKMHPDFYSTRLLLTCSTR